MVDFTSLRVDEHTPMSFVMHLAGQFKLEVKEPPDAETAQRLVTSILKNRHALLILDNAVEWKSLKYMLPAETCSSILITTRSREMYDRLTLLRKGHAEADSDELTIESVFDLSTPLLIPELIETLEYLAVCSPGPVPLDFIRQLAKDEEIEERLERLHNISWCERRERDGELAYELHQLVRELVQRRYGNRFKEDFFQLVHDIFLDDAVHFSVKEKLFSQLEEAFALGKANRDERLKKWLYDLFDFCTNRGYGDFYVRLTQCLEDLFPEDKSTLGTVYRNRGRIYWRQGKLENAMSFHQKSEVTYDELGRRAGLGRTWWNQGHIYKKKKDYKKQEELWRKSIEINKSIGIPTEEDEKKLEELLNTR